MAQSITSSALAPPQQGARDIIEANLALLKGRKRKVAEAQGGENSRIPFGIAGRIFHNHRGFFTLLSLSLGRVLSCGLNDYSALLTELTHTHTYTYTERSVFKSLSEIMV